MGPVSRASSRFITFPAPSTLADQNVATHPKWSGMSAMFEWITGASFILFEGGLMGRVCRSYKWQELSASLSGRLRTLLPEHRCVECHRSRGLQMQTAPAGRALRALCSRPCPWLWHDAHNSTQAGSFFDKLLFPFPRALILVSYSQNGWLHSLSLKRKEQIPVSFLGAPRLYTHLLAFYGFKKFRAYLKN